MIVCPYSINQIDFLRSNWSEIINYDYEKWMFSSLFTLVLMLKVNCHPLKHLGVPWEFLGSSSGVLRVKISNDDNDDGANYKIYNKKVNIKVKLDVLFH